MPEFTYQARDAEGRLREGRFEAESEAAVAQYILSRAMTPVRIEQAREETDILAVLMRRLDLDLPGRDELILFARQMYAITRAGLPLIAGMAQLAESTRHPRLREVIHDIVDDLESGRELSAAMARHEKVFGALFISMVRVGEQSGRLDEAFDRMFHYLTRDQETVRGLKKALRYPTFVLVAIAIAVGIIMTFVIPGFAKLYAGFHLELPLPTRIIIAVATFFNHWWPWMLGGIITAVFVFRRWQRTPEGRLWWDQHKLKIPVIGDIILRGTLARFTGAFAMTFRSGMPILQGLAVTATAVDNAWLEQRIEEMAIAIERGESLSRAIIMSGVFTPLVIQMITVGEDTGQLEDMLEEATVFYEREVAYDVENLSSLIEPLLTVAIGVLVLVLALGVFLPMWDLVEVAKR
ncbi:MAG: type II secretion system F family protein [Gammaproteobacteria bacterium]|nr:MAG: type II secretion system F family protein [Gammaproteobacteria bacterium]